MRSICSVSSEGLCVASIISQETCTCKPTLNDLKPKKGIGAGTSEDPFHANAHLASS